MEKRNTLQEVESAFTAHMANSEQGTMLVRLDEYLSG